MNLNLTEEDKKIFKRVVLLAKSYRPKLPVIYTDIEVDYDGNFDEGWHGKSVYISTTGTGDKDIDYEPFYDFIFEFTKDNYTKFLNPFEDYDESWGSIRCAFNFEKNTLEFSYTVRFYGIDSSEREFEVKNELAQSLINVKNNNSEVLGNIVRMRFDGGGDDGEISLYGENETGDEFELPEEFIDFGYDRLTRYYSGWENNEGGSGYIVLDFSEPAVVNCEIIMDLNSEDSHSDSYEIEINVIF